MLQQVRSVQEEVSRHRLHTRPPCSRIPSRKVSLDAIISGFIFTALLGLFAGLSLEGTALIERKDANRDFYGSPVPARDILSGRVPPPEVASRLYEVIEAAEGIDESGLPENAYVPTANGEHVDLASGRTVFDAEGH